MGNWSIMIKGIGPKPEVRALAQNAVDHLIEELGQNVTQAEFISDTPEHSLNLLAKRDEEAKEKFVAKSPFPVPEPDAPAPEAPAPDAVTTTPQPGEVA